MADPRFDEADAREVIRDLSECLRRIEILKERVFAKSTFSADERAELKDLYATLKTALRERHRHFSKISVQDNLNATEHAFLAPAITKAYVSLSGAINSHPTKWRDGLYCAHMDVAHLLRPLEEIYPGKK